MNLLPEATRNSTTTLTDFVVQECVGRGAYGRVFKALYKNQRTVCALKMITITDNANDGVTFTAARELQHLTTLGAQSRIVRLLDSFVHEAEDKTTEVVFVLEYCAYDLSGLLTAMPTKRHPGDDLPMVKWFMRQVFESLHQCHSLGLMHRDVKSSNLLVTRSGELKLADFGLMCSFDQPSDHTNRVVTLWYRAPELLLGTTKYSPAIDMWAAGCVLVELFTRHSPFPGRSEHETLKMIAAMCGTIDNSSVPGAERLPLYARPLDGAPQADGSRRHLLTGPSAMQVHGFRSASQLRERFSHFGPDALDLLEKLLVLDPAQRIRAQQAIRHPFFNDMPTQCPQLPSQAVHEYEARRKHALDESMRNGGNARGPAVSSGDNDMGPRKRVAGKASIEATLQELGHAPVMSNSSSSAAAAAAAAQAAAAAAASAAAAVAAARSVVPTPAASADARVSTAAAAAAAAARPMLPTSAAETISAMYAVLSAAPEPEEPTPEPEPAVTRRPRGEKSSRPWAAVDAAPAAVHARAPAAAPSRASAAVHSPVPAAAVHAPVLTLVAPTPASAPTATHQLRFRMSQPSASGATIYSGTASSAFAAPTLASSLSASSNMSVGSPASTSSSSVSSACAASTPRTPSGSSDPSPSQGADVSPMDVDVPRAPTVAPAAAPSTTSAPSLSAPMARMTPEGGKLKLKICRPVALKVTALSASNEQDASACVASAKRRAELREPESKRLLLI